MRGSDTGLLILFNQLYMIDKNVVKGIVEQWLEDKDYFLVDVEVSPDDKIVVEIGASEPR